METTITSTGQIINQAGTSANPHECHEFKFQVLFTETSKVEEHISWELLGDIPSNLTIDDSALITGTILPFGLQPTVTDNYPHTPLKMDGSNYLENGRYKNASYTFTFTVKRNYTITNEEIAVPDEEGNIPVLLPIPESSESEISITVIKSANIDNYLYFKEYLDVDEDIEETVLEMSNGEIVARVKTDKRHITYNGVKYYKNDLDELATVHPGPFSKCGLNQ